MALSVFAIKNLKPRKKAYKKADERGLYLLVTPNGSKLWKFKYRYEGKEKKLSFGSYEDVSLKRAHEKRKAARETWGLIENLSEPEPGRHLRRAKCKRRYDWLQCV